MKKSEGSAKFRITALILILILTSAGCSAKQITVEKPSPAKNQITASSKTFEMGFLPIPKQPITTEGWLEAWELLEKNSV